MQYSLIIIKSPQKAVSDKTLLNACGFFDFELTGELIYEDCMSDSEGINIARFNDCIVLSDSLAMTVNNGGYPIDNHTLTKYEKILHSLFPTSDILTMVGSEIVMSYYYSLVQNGVKRRFYQVSDSGVSSYGELLDEENAWFAKSVVIDGKRRFKSSFDKEGEYSFSAESLVDNLPFDVAKRYLGVKLLTNEDEEFMFNTPFKHYVRMPKTNLWKKFREKFSAKK